MMNSELKSFLLALAAVLAWSTVATAFKLTLEAMTTAQMLFYSSLTSTLVLLIIAFLTDRKGLSEIFAPRYFIKNIIYGILNPFVYYLILFKAYDLLRAQEAQILNFIWPLTISLFASLFLKEKASLKIYSGLIIAFLGIVVISTKGSLDQIRLESTLGGILAVASSFVWAGFWTVKILDPRKEAVKLFGAFFWGTFFTAVYIIGFDSFRIESPAYLFGAVYIGIFEMGLTFYLWMMALKTSSNKGVTSTLAYLAPFLSLFFIYALLGESIHLSSVFGLILIIAGILIQRLDKKRTPA